jgi:hypothetical protein
MMAPKLCKRPSNLCSTLTLSTLESIISVERRVSSPAFTSTHLLVTAISVADLFQNYSYDD